MKNFYLKLSMLLLCMVTGLGNVWADDVTFTFKTDKDITYTKGGVSGGGGECIVTKNDVTLSSPSGYTESGKTLTVYKKSTLTITAPGNITAIELEYNGQVYPFDEALGDGKKGEKFAKSGSHPASYTPETPATSVTLNNPNDGKTDLLSLKVTYVAGSAVRVTGVSLDATSKTLTEGETFTLTATIAPANASNKLVAWSSSDETVAKVDKEGEVVSVAPGNATITVKTLDGNYTATCDVTVKAMPEPDEYVLLFAPANADSDSSSSLSATTALNKAFAEGYQYVSSITADKVFPARNSLGYGVKFGSSSAAGTITINLKKAVPAKYIVVSAAAYGDAEGQQGFKVNGNNVSMTTALNKKYCDYVINLDGSDLSTITLTQATASKGRIYVEYIKVLKDDPKLLKNVVKLSAKEDDTFYGTFSSDKVTFFPEDYIVSAVGVENGQLYQFDNEEAFDEDIVEITGKDDVIGYYVPASTGVLVTSLGSVVTYYTAEGVTPSTDVEAVNMLRPASEEMIGDYMFYKLAYDNYADKKDLGFYWGAENGGAFACKPGLAYLAVPTASAAKVNGWALDGTTAAIKSVELKETSAVKKAIVNGQLVIKTQNGIYTPAGAQIK